MGTGALKYLSAMEDRKKATDKELSNSKHIPSDPGPVVCENTFSTYFVPRPVERKYNFSHTSGSHCQADRTYNQPMLVCETMESVTSAGVLSNQYCPYNKQVLNKSLNP